MSHSYVYEAAEIGHKVCAELLKDGVKLYDISGQVLFPIYGMSGGLALSYMFYLLKEGSERPNDCDLGRKGLTDMGGGWKVFAIEAKIPENEADLRKRVAEGIKALSA